MPEKKHKVIVVGLPKTGTSTLAIMLRMLNYKVTGPDGGYVRGDLPFLKEKFQKYDAFQDYPWCFEWEKFINDDTVKFIILKRKESSWFKSFQESYGWSEDRYMAYPFMKIKKGIDNKNQFLDYFKAYYSKLEQKAIENPEKFLTISIETFGWEELCAFLREPLPKTISGKLVDKPHVNKAYNVSRDSKKKKIRVRIRKLFLPIIGRKYWNKIIVFLRKNKIYN